MATSVTLHFLPPRQPFLWSLLVFVESFAVAKNIKSSKADSSSVENGLILLSFSQAVNAKILTSKKTPNFVRFFILKNLKVDNKLVGNH